MPYPRVVFESFFSRGRCAINDVAVGLNIWTVVHIYVFPKLRDEGIADLTNLTFAIGMICRKGFIPSTVETLRRLRLCHSNSSRTDFAININKRMCWVQKVITHRHCQAGLHNTYITCMDPNDPQLIV